MIDKYTDKIYDAVKGINNEDELKENIYNVLDVMLDEYWSELYEQFKSSMKNCTNDYIENVLGGIFK